MAEPQVSGASIGAKGKLIITFINFAYIFFTIVLTLPWQFQEDGRFTLGYGAAISVYAIGILYSFFHDVLCTDTDSLKPLERLFIIIKALSALLCCAFVALYYWLDAASWLITVSFVFSLIPGLLILAEALDAACLFINWKSSKAD